MNNLFFSRHLSQITFTVIKLVLDPLPAKKKRDAPNYIDQLLQSSNQWTKKKSHKKKRNTQRLKRTT